MDRIEKVILRNLVYNEEYLRKVLPFIEPDYFNDRNERVVFEHITKYASEYNSLITKENRDVEVRLYYDERGLDRYYGLLELGEIGGMWKNVAGRYEINGKKLYAKQILANTEEYFTEEVMQKLDTIAKEYFSYGTN